ncbi:hypothetical protein VTK26DRAFT_5772 [Humicola hyalothermophila]
MAEGRDISDLFAIPDLWRPSAWLDQTIGDINKQNPLFTLDLASETQTLASPSKAILPKAQTEHHDTNDLFRLPASLAELVGSNPRRDNEEPLSKTPQPVSDLDSVPEPRTEPSSDNEHDLWLSSQEGPEVSPQCKTWESFEQHVEAANTRAPLFITEAGADAFDVLFALKEPPGDIVPDILDASSYCASLLSLALGQSSILFSWDDENNSFVKTTPYLRISGLSLDIVQAIDSLCLDCGNSARHLQAYAKALYLRASTPTRVALAGVIDRLVVAVLSELNARGRNVRSVLQLQSVVQPAQWLLSNFKRLVKKLAHQTLDEGMLSCLFEEAQASEHRDPLLRGVTREMLRILSGPWLEFVQEWIGLRIEEGVPVSKQGPGKSFVRVADRVSEDDQGRKRADSYYFLDEDRIPSFVSEDMAQTMFETGLNLRFLREHHPEHPLSRPDVISSVMPPSLEWEFEWEALSKLEARVNQYRDAVSRAIQDTRLSTRSTASFPALVKTDSGTADLFTCFGKTETQVEEVILTSIRQLDRPPEDPRSQDRLTLLIRDRLYQAADSPPGSSSLSPHLALVPLLSFGPLIEAQASLINREVTKLLFTAHHLRTHIDLLKQYFLLGNGLLCSRLAHALFDPDLETAERQRGVALGARGTMGLRLGGRKTWPPASSELRLALMGILAECYEAPTTTAAAPPPPAAAATASSPSSPTNSDLPGDLSFAIRSMRDDAEMERILSDPDAVAALDFLRLSYRPPRPLRAVLAPRVLDKYDAVFAALLRVLRMVWVGDALWLAARRSEREEKEREGEGEGETGARAKRRRFAVEARHFIRQVAAYFFGVGVGATWRRFEAWLDRVEAGCFLASRVGGGENTAAAAAAAAVVGACSPDELRERQEQALDEVMAVLLLRRRQAKVLALLEEVFAVVLRFAKALRLAREGPEMGSDRQEGRGGGEGEREDVDSPEELYEVFRNRVEVFMSVCRGLAEKTGKGDNTVEQLLVMLDMGGYYARNAKRSVRSDGPERGGRGVV